MPPCVAYPVAFYADVVADVDVGSTADLAVNPPPVLIPRTLVLVDSDVTDVTQLNPTFVC